MAVHREIIINLGTTRVTFAVFVWGSNGLELKKALSQAIDNHDGTEEGGLPRRRKL